MQATHALGTAVQFPMTRLALTIDWIEASRLEKQYEASEPEAYAAACSAGGC